MFESTYFTYDGVSSEDMGVRIINPGSGLYKEPFMGQRKIVETTVPGRNTPYFTGVDKSPISFPVAIFIEEWQNRNNLRQIARWLNQTDYKPFWFDTNRDRVLDVIFDGSAQIIHNGCKEGYVTLNARGETDMFRSQKKTYNKVINGAFTVNFNNDGDDAYAPYMIIKKIGHGDIGMKLTLENKVITDFKIKEMLDKEIAYVDCANETIRSSYADTERYLFDKIEGDYPTFQLGNIYNQESSTQVEFTGNFEITMEYEVPYLIAE